MITVDEQLAVERLSEIGIDHPDAFLIAAAQRALQCVEDRADQLSRPNGANSAQPRHLLPMNLPGLKAGVSVTP